MSETLREAFVRRLTMDSEIDDRRFRGFNRAIFFEADDRLFPGHAIFIGTDLSMVLAAFDAAVRDVVQP